MSSFTLSERRADAVCSIIKSSSGEEEGEVDLGVFLFPIGVGGKRHVARKGSATAHENRRVEVHFLNLA